MTSSTAPFIDLGSYLHFLEQQNSLKRVRCPVDKDWEIACIARWALESIPEDQAYGILFENVKGHSIPVAVNLYASYDLYAAGLGVPRDLLLDHWAQALADPVKPVRSSQAPVHDVVATAESVNMLGIPVPVWTPGRDAGPYLSAACVITKDPESGIQNMGAYRVQVYDEKHTGLFFGSKLQHGAIHYAKYCKRNESMPVAFVVGAAPALNYACAAKTAYGVDELDIAGGLMGVPVEVVQGKTVDLMVPAHAEYVIEGRVLPDQKRPEGPFGEALGYMNLTAPAPVVEITAICHRRAPVHHGYVQQLPPSDGHLVMEYGLVGPLWFYLTRKLKLGGVRDLAVARGSAGLAMLVAQIDSSQPGAAAAISHALTKLNFGQKFVYIVDDDVDIRDPETLNWVLSSRVDPARDIQIKDETSTFMADPSTMSRAASEGRPMTSPPYTSSLTVIDATIKCRVPEISLPGAKLMDLTRARWAETGLPHLVPRRRTRRLLVTHSDRGVLSDRSVVSGE